MMLALKVERQKQLWDPRYSPQKAKLIAWSWLNSGMKHLGAFGDDSKFGRERILKQPLTSRRRDFPGDPVRAVIS